MAVALLLFLLPLSLTEWERSFANLRTGLGGEGKTARLGQTTPFPRSPHGLEQLPVDLGAVRNFGIEQRLDSLYLLEFPVHVAIRC